MHRDTFIETGPCLLLNLATVSQQTTISHTRSDESALVHGAGQHEETPKVSRVYQQRANPSCKGTDPTLPRYLSLMQKRLSMPQGLCLMTLVKTYVLSLFRHFDFAIPS